MGPRAPAGDSPPGAGRDREALLWRFDQSWQGPTPPRLEDYLPTAGADRALAEEVIAIDLEYRWRRGLGLGSAAPPGGGPRLEDYLPRHLSLGRAEQLSLRIIGREYEIRCSWGRRPSHGEYSQRFPAQGERLLAELRRIDAELAAEFAPAPQRSAAILPGGPPAPAGKAPVPPVPPASAGDLVSALRRWQILRPAQLAELTRPAGDPRVLAGQLIERGWLTPCQVNHLLQGRGAELVLGPYLILDRLGAGGTGQVFRVRNQRLDRIEALKLILKDKLTDSEVVQRFHREVKLTGQLTHPNIVRALDAGTLGPSHFMTMEYVEGADLAKVVKQRGPLPVAEACGYIQQAALGLQHAHERGLVHRDIKPHNLMLTREGVVKVLDLGLARLRRDDPAGGAMLEAGVTAALTPNGAVMMGTPDYLAPEQALDFHAADIRADIYSLGCTFFFLLTGRPPFPGNTLAQKLLRHQQAEPQPIQQARPDAPPGLGPVLARMLAKQPEQRYQTPAEVANALSALGGKAGVLPPASRSAVPARWRRWLALAGLLAGMLLFFWFRPWSSNPTAPPASPTLVLHLCLDETAGSSAQDASGNGRHGALLDGPTWGDGRVGGSLHFDGVKSRLRVANFPYAPTNAFSVAFWFKASGPGSRCLFSHGNTSYPNNLNIFLTEAGAVRTIFRDADDPVSHQALDVVGAFADAAWRHYALIVDADGARVFLDGVQRKASKQGGQSFTPGTSIYLGCSFYGPNGSQHFAGSLDDVRVYASALSAGDVRVLANP